jgi:glyoxylase-like metal-dependent hydrolase (beta-lactamase superfamily II)
MTTKILPHSEHFTYQELAEGVWAAIVITTGLAASNSGIVDLGDRTLIFDTTLSPASALDLRNAAESLTGRNVAYVFNSHFHNDHVFGNAIFDSTTEIYTTARTREIMTEKTEAGIIEFKKHWPEQLINWGESAKTAKDETERLDYEDNMQFAQSIIDTFPQLKLRLPDHTFTDRLEFKGPKRTVEFISFGGGHTDSDAFLYLPAEGIIFTGDLLVIKNHPDLTYGNPHEWLNIFAKIKTLEPARLVPGHGEIGTLADVTLIELYINALLQMAEQIRLEGGTAESVTALQPPSFTEGWNNIDAFERNMKFLFEKTQRK